MQALQIFLSGRLVRFTSSLLVVALTKGMKVKSQENGYRLTQLNLVSLWQINYNQSTIAGNAITVTVLTMDYLQFYEIQVLLMICY